MTYETLGSLSGRSDNFGAERRPDKHGSSITKADADAVADVHVAIALYNDIRTSLEETGWTVFERADDPSPTPGYWWRHPKHPHAHSMSAAHSQWRMDIEAAKAGGDVKPVWCR